MAHTAGAILVLLFHALRFITDMVGDSFDIVLVLLAVGFFVLVMNRLDTKKPRAKRPPARHPQTRTTALPPPMPEPYSRSGRKKHEVPFEIPPIAGAPHPEDGKVYQEAETAQERMEEYRQEQVEKSKYQQYLEEKQRQEAVEAAAYAQQTGAGEIGRQPSAPPQPALALTPQAMVQAVIYAEILGKPKAYQHRQR